MKRFNLQQLQDGVERFFKEIMNGNEKTQFFAIHVKVVFSRKNDSFNLNIQIPAKFFARSENLNLPHILP